MPGQPPATVNYCEQRGAPVNPDAKYCQTCGEAIWQSEAIRQPADPDIQFFRTSFVTLISIIQAAALGYLLLAAKDQLSYVVAGTYDPIWTVLILGMFILIVATWVIYTQQPINWRLTTLDALIPFCFASTQALVIFSISMHQLAWFYFAMTANAYVGLSHNAVVYRNMRVHQEHEVNRAYVERWGPWSKQRLPQWFAIRSAIFLLFGKAEAVFNLQSLLFAVVYLILNAVSLIGVHLTGQAQNKWISELTYKR